MQDVDSLHNSFIGEAVKAEEHLTIFKFQLLGGLSDLPGVLQPTHSLVSGVPVRTRPRGVRQLLRSSSQVPRLPRALLQPYKKFGGTGIAHRAMGIKWAFA